MPKLTIKEALIRLAEENSDYVRLIGEQKFDLGLYRPAEIDAQTPHVRDELYIVAAGTGDFICADEIKSFGPGDVFFVSAGIEHRFVNFSRDFATWVVFFGARFSD